MILFSRLTPNIELLDEEIHPSNVYFHFQYDCIQRSTGLHLHANDRLGGLPNISNLTFSMVKAMRAPC